MAHVDNLRRHFPSIRNGACLNTGSYGALPDAAVQAMQNELARQLSEGRGPVSSHPLGERVSSDLRDQMSALFGGRPQEYALMDGVAEGLNSLLWGLPLGPGDEIIYSDSESADAKLAVFAQKQRRGVVLRCLDTALAEVELLAQLQTYLSARTRVVVVSHVAADTGRRMPFERIAKLAHSAGAYCFVDGSQGAGAEAINLPDTGVDGYVFPGHLWLGGPDGTGAVYLSDHLTTALDATYVGPASLKQPGQVNRSGHFLCADAARKLEHSTGASVVWLGWLESLKFLRVQVGWDYAYSRIHGLSGQLFDLLLDFEQVRVVTPREARAGIVSFQVRGVAAEEFVKLCAERQIFVDWVPERDLVRASCGFYTSEDDISRLANVLKGLE